MVRKGDGRGRRFEPNEAGRFLKNRDPGRQFARRRGRKETAAEAPPYGSRNPALIGQGPIVDSSTEGGPCTGIVRSESLRAAGRRYQSSRRGRHCHAERQKRYRRQCLEGDREAFIRIVGKLLLALPLLELGPSLKTLELLLRAICVRSLGCVGVLKDRLADGLWTVVEERKEVLDWSALTAPRSIRRGGKCETPN